MAVDINIAFDSQFGNRGSGNNQFNYASGCCVVGTELVVVDRQNHRITRHQLDGTYIGTFGSEGSGNDEFYFPEGITTDGNDLFIVDSGNHRVKHHRLDGTYLNQWGSQGSGAAEFDYPKGITYQPSKTGSLFVADSQNHRIKKYTTDGTYISSFGSYGTGEGAGILFNFPSDVRIIDNNIYVVDSGNKKVQWFTLSYTKVGQTAFAMNAPMGIEELDNNIICVVDWQDAKLYFMDVDGNLLDEYGGLGSGDDEFDLPYMAWYDSDNSILYVVDSANFRVKLLTFDSDETLPAYIDRLVAFTKQLYPTGRAWWMKRLGIFYRLHEGLAYSESRAYENMLGILDSILPDNDNFSADDATNWENALGLYNSSFLTLEQRKTIILRKMQYPGGILARQNYLFIQAQIRAAGFDVYIHPNRFADGSGGYNVVAPTAAIYGEFNYGDAAYGDEAIAGATYLANYVNESKDGVFLIGGEDNYKATFFVCGATYPNFANVPESRKEELRLMLLRLKPAQTVGILLINYT